LIAPISFDQVKPAKGHNFRGGKYTIEHWENFLLTACTGAELMQSGAVHPIALFHLPILGSGTTIAEMFSLGLADSDMSIAIESYDWQLFEPLRENRDYDVKGEISEVTRHNDKPENSGPIYDRIVFDFTVGHKGSPTASSTVIWHYRRGLT
jgi:hypothetical protein